MKKIIMISCFLAAGVAAFAQKDHRLYRFEQVGGATEVHRYGEAPEFPFLRNLSTREQFVAALHRGGGNTELNGILKGIGFARGAKDVTTASVSDARIPEGTIGNMGDARHNYLYAKLYSDGGGVKAWKVTADNGTVIYFISKCGNAFYADPNANGQVTARTEDDFEGQRTIPDGEPARPVCKDKVYIYYGGVKKIHRGWEVYANDLDVDRCYHPEDAGAVARAQEEPAKAYENISAEKTSVYLGFKPAHQECIADKKYRQALHEAKWEHKRCDCHRHRRW